MSQLDQILDQWAARATAADIAQSTGLPLQRIRYIVFTARAQGDARAAKRGRKDGRPHADSMGIYRARDEVKALKETVLDAWAQGFDGYAIAAAIGIERGYVDAIVSRARRAGDGRAVRRSRFVLPPGGGRRHA